ncbi:MAG TPA: cytochrome c3 family protein, partial [Ardenticatenaceae bacterium]|nr:cytochrome c3 family protein [Ardenticatenaceae bacterium]
VTIFGADFMAGGTLIVLYLLARSPYSTAVGVVRAQPVQFSHEHHVRDDGIDCRYCHTTVEVSPFAGIPPTETCMNCHRQIWSQSPALAPVRESWENGEPLHWTRVHDLPDFVYFNHSIHVQKGIGCESCHGRVDLMPLMMKAETMQMEWCLDCHRAPEKFVRPREEVFTMGWQPPEDQEVLGQRLVQEYGIERKLDCTTCHR